MMAPDSMMIPDDCSAAANLRLYYLGPVGSFTHQAAQDAARAFAAAHGGASAPELIPCDTAADIVATVEAKRGIGIIAWESNVEGYVTPNLDALIDAHDLVGIGRTAVDISFDAMIRPGSDGRHGGRRDGGSTVAGNPNDGRRGGDAAADSDSADKRRGGGARNAAADSGDGNPSGTERHGIRVPARLREITAHPHGLAQCKGFVERMGLPTLPAVSNAAACRDLAEGQIALGPSLCAELYGLETLERGVQDYRGGRTEFLVIAPRTWLARLRPFDGHDEFESIIAFIPLHTGAGVLADLLDVLRDQGLNMTSFISRPIKGNDGTYSFIATFDAAPWEPRFRTALRLIADHGDWVKTLAVYPRRERPDPPVETWMLPNGGVHVPPGTLGEAPDGIPDAVDGASAGMADGTPHGAHADGWDTEGAAGRELLWDGPAAWR